MCVGLQLLKKEIGGASWHIMLLLYILPTESLLETQVAGGQRMASLMGARSNLR